MTCSRPCWQPPWVAALAMLGPGRWSVDARLFGWKRIEASPRRRTFELALSSRIVRVELVLESRFSLDCSLMSSSDDARQHPPVINAQRQPAGETRKGGCTRPRLGRRRDHL